MNEKIAALKASFEAELSQVADMAALEAFYDENVQDLDEMVAALNNTMWSAEIPAAGRAGMDLLVALKDNSALIIYSDFYYPDEVNEASKRILGDTIMREDVETVDSFTAYLVGWTDQISDKSLEFLRETAHITYEEWVEANKNETYTGYVENKQYDGYVYTGELKNGVKYVAEGANMPSTLEAIDTFQAATNVVFLPAKAANAGGVATSALEMAQSSGRLYWSSEEVDAKLKTIMINIYHNIDSAAKRYGFEGNYVMGANIAGFEKVAEAMMAHGIV